MPPPPSDRSPNPAEASETGDRKTFPGEEQSTWTGADEDASTAEGLEGPLVRRPGARAQQASLRARVAACRAAGDFEGEGAAAAALARSLAARGSELDAATKLARSALVAGDDAILRDELSGWFAGLGEAMLAAATLRPALEDQPSDKQAATLTRIAVLHARAGQGDKTVAALEDATRLDDRDPVPAELLGAVGAWDPEALPPRRAADAYLEGTRRREARGERPAAFEDLLRAFEMAPESPLAAELLTQALAGRGRLGAADEVSREHAEASGERRRLVHVRRVQDAVSEGELVRALGAALDAHLEAEVDPQGALRALEAAGEEAGDDEPAMSGGGGGLLDDLLARLGLHELLAARLELASEALLGEQRSRCCLALGRLYAGPLASSDRAVEAWIDALVSDPSSEEAKTALRSHAAATRDQTPLLEALIRVARSEEPEHRDARVGCLRELAVMAEQRLSDPALSLWALRRLLQLTPSDEELQASIRRLEPRARLQDEALGGAVRQLDKEEGASRAEPLRRCAAVLRGRPDAAKQYIEVLTELADLAPGERVWQLALERVLFRQDKLDVLAERLERSSEGASTRAEAERARLALSSLARNEADNAKALAQLEPLIDESGSHRAAWSMAFLLASSLGDHSLRARALLRLAAPLKPALKAVLSSIASDSLLTSGQSQAAFQAAEQACHADPSQARPVAALARASVDRRDRLGAAALERAMGVVVPRAQLCCALAQCLDEAGETELSLAWTQRWLALRPGDPEAASVLLARTLRAKDGSRLADALSWVLSRAQPLGELASLVGEALIALAQLDESRGAALARRALDVFGPRADTLRAAVLEVAEMVGEPGLAIAVAERRLAAGGLSGPEQVLLLLDVARRRKRAGDSDGFARALGRALEAGADAERILEELAGAPPPRGSDGEIYLLEARVSALSKLPDTDPVKLASALRHLGALLWDLAGDQDGAIEMWERCASLVPEGGVARFSRDLVAFAGYQDAISRLAQRAERIEDAQQRAAALATAATLALEGGDERRAFDLAAQSLELKPNRSELLAILERCGTEDDRDRLEDLYQKVAGAALGIYGERAVFYRAARQFERQGNLERAFQFAIRAFEAVPAEGVTFVLMARLAGRVDGTARAVQAIEGVAEQAKHKHQQAAWLEKATVLAGGGAEGLRQRIDVLLRALAVQPSTETVAGLAAAVRDLLAEVPDEAEILELRIERAFHSLWKGEPQTDDAPLAVAAALMCIEALSSCPLALLALRRALKANPEAVEMARLLPHAEALAQQEDARGLLQQQLGVEGEERLGRPALELLGAIARALDEQLLAARALVLAARREPDDADLISAADAAARATGEAELVTLLLGAVPPRERVRGYVRLAREASRTDHLGDAIEALEQALQVKGIEDDQREEVVGRLRDLYGRAGRRGALEKLLLGELTRPGLGDDDRMRLTRDLAALVGGRGEAGRALELLESLVDEHPEEVGPLEDMVDFARQAGDSERQLSALRRLVDLVAGGRRLDYQRELANLLSQQGDEAAADEAWAEVLKLAPDDNEAVSALEQTARRSGDWERVAALLARQAATAHADDARILRLKRVRVLDQHLGRPDAARTELEAMLQELGDDLQVLRGLADLNERLGEQLRAAPIWLRAGALAEDRTEASILNRRSVGAYLAGGDVDSARRVLEGMEAWAASDELRRLRVEIERRSENPVGLAEALEELALASMDPPEQRAQLLVEAAQATVAAGDPAVALGRAQRAARIAPTFAPAQLTARLLEYQQRGVGSIEDARATATELRGIDGDLETQDAELRAFLLAEALDTSSGRGSGAGMRELQLAHAALGDLPLIALGMAERLAASGEPQRALNLYDHALDGDLRGLRKHGEVALAAVRAARESGDEERALSYLEDAAAMPESRARALALQDEIKAQGSVPPPADEADVERRDPVSSVPAIPPPALDPAEEAAVSLRSPPIPRDEPAEHGGRPIPRDEPGADPPSQEQVVLAEQAPPGSIEEALQAEARKHSSLPPRDEPEASDERAGSPASARMRAAAPPKPSRRPQKAAPKVASSAPPPRSSAPPPASSPPASSAPPSSQDDDLPSSNRLLAAATEEQSTPLSEEWRRSSLLFPPKNDGEGQLLAGLSRGDVGAGKELIRQLQNRSDRTQDLVRLCRHVSTLVPGERWTLERLYEAAASDHDLPYARALEHVLKAFGHDEPVSAPDLAAQGTEPTRVHAILFQEGTGAAAEALALVWQGAQHVFRRDPGTYGVTGLERVPLNSSEPAGVVYAAAARVLGLQRTPMFMRRSMSPITVSVALLSPPAIIVAGDVRFASVELAYHMGSMLAATLPQYVLLYGATEAQARGILKGLALAFGPPQASNKGLASVATLAEVLWESIPARAQRRLRELCDDPQALDYDAALTAARLSIRRAGLFVSGDVEVAVREACSDEGIPTGGLSEPGGLAALCAASPAVSDLVLLATSPEYAEARWQLGQGGRWQPGWTKV